MKRCTKCDELKPLDQFYRHAASRDGRRPDCKECLDARAVIYRNKPENKKRVSTYMKQYKTKMTAEKKRVYAQRINRSHEKSPRQALSLSRNHALARHKTENPITIAELFDLWKRQQGRCALSGVEMTWRKGRILPTSISLDRVDGQKGYTVDNVRLVCYSVNALRHIGSDEEMLAMAEAIVSHMKPTNMAGATAGVLAFGV